MEPQQANSLFVPNQKNSLQSDDGPKIVSVIEQQVDQEEQERDMHQLDIKQEVDGDRIDNQELTSNKGDNLESTIQQAEIEYNQNSQTLVHDSQNFDVDQQNLQNQQVKANDDQIPLENQLQQKDQGQVVLNDDSKMPMIDNENLAQGPHDSDSSNHETQKQKSIKDQLQSDNEQKQPIQNQDTNELTLDIQDQKQKQHENQVQEIKDTKPKNQPLSHTETTPTPAQQLLVPNFTNQNQSLQQDQQELSEYKSFQYEPSYDVSIESESNVIYPQDILQSQDASQFYITEPPQPHTNLENDINRFMERISRWEMTIRKQLPKQNYASIFISLLKRCKVQVTPEQTDGFDYYIEAQLQELDDSTEGLSYEDFMECLSNWFYIYRPKLLPLQKEQQNGEVQVKHQLEKTIYEFQQLRDEQIKAGIDTDLVDNLLQTLQLQFYNTKNSNKDLQKRQKKERMLVEQQGINGLKQVFAFYASQQKMLGIKPSFDEIERNKRLLTLGKYMRFCKDYGIYDNRKVKNRRIFDRNFIRSVFNKNSTYQRDMNEHQFLQSIEQLANEYYNEEYDILFSTEYKDLPLNEKLIKFYQALGVHNNQVSKGKQKGFGTPFNSKKNERIPSNDISKRYNYKPSNRLNSKYKEPSMYREPRQKESQEIYQTPAIEYQPFTIPEEPPATNSGNQLITWQKLGQINPQEIHDEEFDINDLIVEESDEEKDEILGRQYPLTTNNKTARTNVNFNLSPTVTSKGFSGLKTSRSISLNTLKRADELAEIARKSEQEHMERVMKMANSHMERSSKYIARRGYGKKQYKKITKQNKIRTYRQSAGLVYYFRIPWQNSDFDSTFL